MKSLRHKQSVLLLTILLMIASTAMAYPRDPDNAALLYYQAFISFPKDHDQISVDAVVDGTAEPNETVRTYITKCRTSIELALAAAELKTCDWGMRYSQGFEAVMGHLAQMRSLSRVIATQAQILIYDGQMRQGLKHYLVMRKMAQHAGDDLIISYLVRVVVKSMADQGIRQILNHKSLDQETLTWLKQQLVTGPDLPGNINKAFKIEEEITLDQMSVEKDRLVAMIIKDNQDISADDKARLKSVGEPFYAANRAYYQQQMQQMHRILDGPHSYKQKYQGFVQLIKTVRDDAQHKEEAILTALMVPALQRLVTGQTKAHTDENALHTALELFIIRARTGALPDQLPSSAALDQFSGKPFQYNKNSQGFTLKCQAEDLDKNIVHEYAFLIQ